MEYYERASATSMGDYYSMESGSKVQELYERSRMVFCGYDGISPSIDEIRWLQGFLDTVEASDVGIDDGEGPRREGMIPGWKLDDITYVHIYECDEFSMGVFCFPAGATLPLHDHPGMVVLSKVLYGSVVARAYDWVKPPDQFSYGKCGLARLVVNDKVLQATSMPSVLFPMSGGNLHSFTALTPCAFLDILSPPYSDEQGRPSTYFSEIPINSLHNFMILKERGVPEDLTVVGVPYLGPELVVDEGDDDNNNDDFY